MAEWIRSHAWLFMAVPAGAYALWALGLKLDGKPWTSLAWLCYVGANICFLVAHIKGE